MDTVHKHKQLSSYITDTKSRAGLKLPQMIDSHSLSNQTWHSEINQTHGKVHVKWPMNRSILPLLGTFHKRCPHKSIYPSSLKCSHWSPSRPSPHIGANTASFLQRVVRRSPSDEPPFVSKTSAIDNPSKNVLQISEWTNTEQQNYIDFIKIKAGCSAFQCRW